MVLSDGERFRSERPTSMTLQSMTGFAAKSDGLGDIRWQWEIKSVNGKGLDLRFRAPQGWEDLEPQLRKLVGQYIVRGNIQLNLRFETAITKSQLAVDQEALEQVIGAIKQVSSHIECSKPSAEAILAIKGVLHYEECTPDGDILEALQTALIASFEQLLTDFVMVRKKEGSALHSVLKAQLATMEQLVQTIADDPALTQDRIAQKLNQQIKQITQGKANLDADRLHAEIALLATKSDIREELDRLRTHLDSAQQLIVDTHPVGRKLDFLCQEFLRETNTICSKSSAASITQAGLDMKIVIEQFREQVQNIE